MSTGPTAAYYRLESKLRWVGDCSEANGNGGHGGIIARELNSGSSAAVGLLCQNGSLSVAYWQDTLNLIDSVELPTGVKEVWVRMDVELLLIKPWYSLDGYAWDWVKAKGHIHDDPQVQVSLFLSFIHSFFLSYLLTFLLFPFSHVVLRRDLLLPSKPPLETGRQDSGVHTDVQPRKFAARNMYKTQRQLWCGNNRFFFFCQFSSMI